MKKTVTGRSGKPKRKVAQAAQGSPEMQGAMEELLQQFAAMVGEHVPASDIEAFSASLSGPSIHAGRSRAEADAKDEAQEIAFEAMEAKSDAQARRLARRALKLDPDCVDALVLLVDLDAKTVRARIEGLQAAIAAAERTLGQKYIRDNEGDFWMLLETRPYMRALEQLGGELSDAGMSADAISVYAKMLKLNPNDNQGVRDPLLGLYLAAGDLAGAAKLLKRYKGDASATFAWGRVIERFAAKDEEGANAALTKALKSNRFVALQLTGRMPVDNRLPAMYSPGSAEEAALSLYHLGAAWVSHKAAVMWLYDRCAALGMTPQPDREMMKRMIGLSAKTQ